MRTPRNLGFHCEPISDLSKFTKDIRRWFEQQPAVGEPAWLLAYAEDGVIWGKMTAGKLLLPTQSTQLLQPLTLLEARLFGESWEIHVWRVDDGFRACRTEDRPQEGSAYDEYQRLWGTEQDDQGDGFTLLIDGREDLRQTVPLIVPAQLFLKGGSRYHPVVLQTRHYFGYDAETGATSIALSRLVGLQSESREAYRKRAKPHE